MKRTVFAISILLSLPIIIVYGETEIDIDFMLYKGNQYSTLGQYKESISYYDSVLKVDPNNVDALYNMGNAFSTLGNHKNAIQYFEKTIYLNPNNFNAAIKLHDSLLQVTSYKIGFLEGVLEIKVHDSNGNLVAYLQTNEIKAIKHNIIERLVDKWTVSEVIQRNNQTFEVRQQEFTKTVVADTIYGLHQIPYSNKVDLPLASTWHYQIPVEKGDTVSYTYSIFRPAD